jgi:hypothetical protein
MTTLQLPYTNPGNVNISSKSVTVDTTARIKQPTANTCAAVLEGRNPTNADSFLGSYNVTNLQTKLNNIASILSDPNIGSSANINTVMGAADVARYISNVQTNDIPTLRFMINCIEESTASPDLHAYEEAKQVLDASKERLEMVRNPENHVSNYEGWFPLTRPMRESSLFIIFGIGLLLFLLSIVLFIKRQGVEINVATSPGYELAVKSVYQTVKGYGLLIVVAGSLIGYLVHIYSKN